MNVVNQRNVYLRFLQASRQAAKQPGPAPPALAPTIYLRLSLPARRTAILKTDEVCTKFVEVLIFKLTHGILLTVIFRFGQDAVVAQGLLGGVGQRRGR